MRRDGQPASAYAWHVAPGGVLVVVDLNRHGWRSVANDAAGVIHDLAELRPDLLSRVPLVLYQARVQQLCHEPPFRAKTRRGPENAQFAGTLGRSGLLKRAILGNSLDGCSGGVGPYRHSERPDIRL